MVSLPTVITEQTSSLSVSPSARSLSSTPSPNFRMKKEETDDISPEGATNSQCRNTLSSSPVSTLASTPKSLSTPDHPGYSSLGGTLGHAKEGVNENSQTNLFQTTPTTCYNSLDFQRSNLYNTHYQYHQHYNSNKSITQDYSSYDAHFQQHGYSQPHQHFQDSSSSQEQNQSTTNSDTEHSQESTPEHNHSHQLQINKNNENKSTRQQYPQSQQYATALENTLRDNYQSTTQHQYHQAQLYDGKNQEVNGYYTNTQPLQHLHHHQDQQQQQQHPVKSPPTGGDGSPPTLPRPAFLKVKKQQQNKTKQKKTLTHMQKHTHAHTHTHTQTRTNTHTYTHTYTHTHKHTHT